MLERLCNALQTGSICKPPAKVARSYLAKCYEKVILAAFIITQHLTSVPSQIKEMSFTSSSLLLPSLIISLALNHFQSMHSLCLWTHCELAPLPRKPCTGIEYELRHPRKLSHSRQAIGKFASHRAGLLFKTSKFHKKWMAADFYYLSLTSNKILSLNCKFTPPLTILNFAFMFLYKDLKYTSIF